MQKSCLVSENDLDKNKTAAQIHPTAVIAKTAQLDNGVEVGPYSVIGPHARIGKDTRILSHAVIEGRTTIGERCQIFSGACIGTPPQVKKIGAVTSFISIGNDNVIREYVTIHPAMKENASTQIGDRNFLMVGTHVAHDCVLGNDIVIANNTALGGHVVLEDKVVIGGLVGIHQFSRVGKLVMIGAMSRVTMDLPPFSTYVGYPAKFFGLNLVGLRRDDYKSKNIADIKKAFKILFQSGLLLSQAVEELKNGFKDNPDIECLLSFIQKSKRGITRQSQDVDLGA
jgi:UDP-N-acetylglucosamine acyltransferase